MIRVVERALRTCELLAARSPQPLRELAAALRVRRSTLCNLMSTLVAAGYVERRAGGYALADRFPALSEPRPAAERFARLGEDACRRLAEALGEGAALTVLGPRGKQVVAQVEHAAAVTVIHPAAWRDSPLWSSSTGRILAAYASPARLRTLLARLGPPRVEEWPEAARGRLDHALDTVREAGECAALTRGGRMGSFAVPVHGAAGTVCAALGVYVPGERCSAETSRAALRALRTEGEALSRRLRRWGLPG